MTKNLRERSKYNALSHGLFSKVVVLKSEPQARFDAFLSALCEDLRPVGMLEESLVENLAVTRWRQRRLLVAEVAEIEAGKAFLKSDKEQRQIAEAGNLTLVSSEGGLIRKIANDEVFEACITMLEVLRASIEKDGFVAEYDEPILTLIYGPFDGRHWQLDLYVIYMGILAIASLTDDARKENKLPSREACKSDFLDRLLKEMDRVTHEHYEKDLIESERMELESLRRYVPDSPGSDRLLKYSVALERTFDRTLAQLERVQLMRRGQPVAPQLDVRIST